MMCKGKRKSATLYFVAVVFLVWYLAETAECYRRRKPLKIDVRKEADSTQPVGVREGEILFGKSLKGPESQLTDGTNQPSSNTSVEDETGYQADPPALPYDQAHMDAWKGMTKSLQCGADQMHFKVVGAGHQHFAVDPPNGPSLPLPHVPPSCGYNMRRFPSFLHLSIPYSGCNVLQEGGYYMLPLTWHGIPIVLSCRAPPPAGNTPNWRPIPHCPPFRWCPPVDTTTSQPITDPVGWPMDPWPVAQHSPIKPWDHWHSLTAATPMPQVPPQYPFPWYHKHPHFHHHPYYNYFYYHSHPHYHYPYWLHAQDPTPDSPPMTTMMPYVPVHYPPHAHGQRKWLPDHINS